jgi:hypothetical protein
LRAAIGQPSPGGSSSVQDMKLNFSGDRMRMYVLLNVRGKDLTVELEGKLRTLDGYLDFEPLSGRIGALPVPRSSLKKAFERMIANPENRRLLQLPKELRDVHVEDSKIVVAYR